MRDRCLGRGRFERDTQGASTVSIASRPMPELWRFGNIKPSAADHRPHSADRHSVCNPCGSMAYLGAMLRKGGSISRFIRFSQR